LTESARRTANRSSNATNALVIGIGPFVNRLCRAVPRGTTMETPPMSPSLSGRMRTAATIWLAWTAAGLFYVTQDFVPRLYRNESVPWQGVFVGWMAAMYICAAFTPAILSLGRRWPLDRERRWQRIALHMLFASVFSVASQSLEAPVLMALGVFPPGPQSRSLAAAASWIVVYGFHGGVIRYWAVIGVQTLVRAHQLQLRSSELGAQLTAAHLSALKMQLQPHFLFNTLGAIMVLVQQRRTQEAEEVLGRLSDLLRLSLEDVDTQEVPLWRELEFLHLYLSIERIRFQDRLRVHIRADRDVLDALVPHMVLQPIVENAVRHGLGQSEDAVTVEVSAERGSQFLVLTVADDGPGSTSPRFDGPGIGLTNTRNRLNRLYGDGATLRAENRQPHGARITVTLPCRTAPSEDRPCV
jgi:two-component system, LytTR family, sensor kinase